MPTAVRELSSRRARRAGGRGLVGLTVTALLALSYAGVLFYAYRDYVQPVFDYDGLTFRHPEPFDHAAAIGLVVLVAILLPQRIRRPSDLVMWLFFVTSAAPAILLAQYTQNLDADAGLRFAFAAAGCMIFIRAGAAARPRFRLVGLVDPGIVWIALVTFAVATYGMMIGSLGLNFRWVNLGYVYNVRAEYGNAVSGNRILGYALPIVFDVINPVLIARGVYSKRYRWLAAGAGGQLLIFMTIGLKSVLFSIVGIVAIAWLFRADLRLRGVKLMGGIIALAAVANAMDRIFGGYLWDQLFLRRYIVIPGFLPVAYVGIFQALPKNGFAGSPLFWETSQYPRGASYIVGRSLTGNAFNNANSSLLGNGYWNDGYLGVFIEAAVLVLILWLVDNAARGLPTPVAAIVMFMPTYAISSTGIFTVIASHGLLAAIVVLAVLPRTGWGRRVSPRRSVASGRTRVSTEAQPAHR